MFTKVAFLFLFHLCFATERKCCKVRKAVELQRKKSAAVFREKKVYTKS